MSYLRSFEKNLPPEIKNQIDQEAQQNLVSIVSGLKSSLEDESALLNNYFPALHRYVSLYKLPKQTLVEVIELLYAQLSKHMSVLALNSTLSLLSRLLKNKKNLSLVLDQKVLYKLYRFYMSSSVVKTHLLKEPQVFPLIKSILELIKKAQKYFSKDSTRSTFEKFEAELCPGGNVSLAFLMMTNLVNPRVPVPEDLVEKFIAYWEAHHRFLNVDMNMCAFLGDASKHTQINWDSFLGRIYDLLSSSKRELPSNGPKPYKIHDNLANIMNMAVHKQSQAHYMAKFIVYSLKLEGNSLQLFKKFILEIRSQFKEPKKGSFGVTLLKKLCLHMCKRLRRSKENLCEAPSEELLQAFYKAVKPCFAIAVHTRQFQEAIGETCSYLSFLVPQEFIPFAFEQAFVLLDDFDIPHLFPLNMILRLLRATLDENVFNEKERIPQVLQVCLTEMSSSDMKKTCCVLDIIGLISSLTQLETILMGAFEEWSEAFFGSLLEVLSELEEKEDDQTKQSFFHKADIKIRENLERNFRLVVSSVENTLTQEWEDTFLRYIRSNTAIFACEEFGVIAAVLSEKNSKFVVKLQEVAKSVLSSDRSHKEIQWFVQIYSESLASCVELSEISFEVESVVNLLLEHQEESIQNLAGLVLHNYLVGLVSIVPKAYKGIPDWKVPSQENLETSVKLLEKYLGSQDPKKKIKTLLGVVTALNRFSSEETHPCQLKIAVHTREVPQALKNLTSLIWESIKTTHQTQEEPKVLEGFVKVLSHLLKNPEKTIAVAKQEQRSLKHWRNLQSNPTLPLKERANYDTDSYKVLKAQVHLNLRHAYSASQKASNNYTEILNLLLELSSHKFTSVAYSAQTALKKGLDNNFVDEKEVVAKIWTEILEKIQEVLDCDEQLKVFLELISSRQGVLWSKAVQSRNQGLVDLLLKTQHKEDTKIQSLLFNVFSNYVIGFSSPVKFSFKEDPVIPKDHFEKVWNSTERILENLESYYWRYKLYGLVYLLLNLPSINDNQKLNKVSEVLLPLLLDDNADIRDVALLTMNTLLRTKAQCTLPKPEKVQVPLKNFTAKHRYLELSDLENENLGKLHHGWTSKQFRVKQYSKLVYSDSQDPIFKFITNPENSQKLLSLLAVSHMISEEEKQVQNPRVSPFSQLNFLSCLNNPSKLIKMLFSGTNSSEFGLSFACFFRQLAQVYGPSGLEALVAQASSYIGAQKEYEQVCGEVLSGILAGTEYWSDFSLPLGLLEKLCKEGSFENMSVWTQAFNFMCHKKGCFLGVKVYKVLYGALENTKRNKKMLSLLKEVIGLSLGWKGVDLYPELLRKLGDLQTEYFADLREKISGVVAEIALKLCYVSEFPVNDSFCCEKFRENSYLVTYKPVNDFLDRFKEEGDLYKFLPLEFFSKMYTFTVDERCFWGYIKHHYQYLFSFLTDSNTSLVQQTKRLLNNSSCSKTLPVYYSQLLELIRNPPEWSWQFTSVSLLIVTYNYLQNQYTVDPPLELMTTYLKDPNAEIRNTARDCLTLIFKNLDKDSFVEEFTQLPQKEAALGLSALVLSCKEWVENYHGKALMALCSLRKGSTESCVKYTLSEFWKAYKPWWVSYLRYRDMFSEDEALSLEDFRSEHSYFA